MEGTEEESNWGNYRVRVGFIAPNISEIAQTKGLPNKIAKNLFTYQTVFEAHEVCNITRQGRPQTFLRL